MSKYLMISVFFLFVIGANALNPFQSSTDATQKEIAESSSQSDQITLNYQTYEKDRQGPVVFSHMKHAREYEINCWECHHEYSGGDENIWAPWRKTEKCIECHEPNRNEEGAISLTAAFHLNCKVCHEERDIYQGEIEEYKDCSKCHLRDILIENEGYEDDRKGPVPFQHRKHESEYLNPNGEQIACAECHHEYVNGKNTWTEADNVKGCGAVGCHDPVIAKGERQYSLRFAYHKNCRDCHKALKTADESKNAPSKNCSACHR
jgi:hypothetical protein